MRISRMKIVSNRTRYRWIALAVLAPTLAACGAGQSATEAAQAAQDRDVLVLATDDVARATRSPMSTGVVLTGSLDPYQVVEIRAQVPGLVRNLRVDRGAAVTRGQTLATIEAEGIRSQAAAAQANLALAQRQLESARILHENGAMSDLDFTAVQAAFEAARAQAAAAQENAQYASVTSPITGYVSNRMISEGEAANPGAPLFTVVDTDSLELKGQIPVEQAARVRVGLPVEFTLSAYPGRVFRGTVARVEPTADPTTRQVGVYLRLDNTQHRLVGGLFATGRILTGTMEDAVVVPTAAVRSGAGGEYVWVIEQGIVARRAIVTGERDETRGIVQIVEGLAGGEQVIAAPGAITEGTRVRVSGGPTEAAAREAA